MLLMYMLYGMMWLSLESRACTFFNLFLGHELFLIKAVK